MRTLIGGVGYRNLGDLSFGPRLIDRLAPRQWPAGVEVEDLSYGPVAIMHSLDERQPFSRMIFIAGVARGSTPAEIRLYRWSGELPDREEVQARVVEAVTGVISLENLLVVAAWFGKLPPEVIVLEVEPQNEECGDGLSPCVEAAIPGICSALDRILAGDDVKLRRYDYLIPAAEERPRGWVVRAATS